MRNKRISNTKIGDIFCAKINEEHKKYLQYIVSDMSQLNSDVIRAFAKKYPLETNPSLDEIINDKVDFYAHCVTKSGIRRDIWEKIGNTPDVGRTDSILFQTSEENGVEISHDWRVWEVNKPDRYVKKLKGKYKDAEIGLVIQPEYVLHRMKTGSYPFKYPSSE